MDLVCLPLSVFTTVDTITQKLLMNNFLDHERMTEIASRLMQLWREITLTELSEVSLCGTYDKSEVSYNEHLTAA